MKAQDKESRCSFAYRDGRRCRMLISREHPSLCVFHHRQQLKQTDARPSALSSMAALGALDNGRAVRRALRRVVRDLADGRLMPGQARVLAQIGRLLLVYTRPARKLPKDTA